MNHLNLLQQKNSLVKLVVPRIIHSQCLNLLCEEEEEGQGEEGDAEEEE